MDNRIYQKSFILDMEGVNYPDIKSDLIKTLMLVFCEFNKKGKDHALRADVIYVIP